MYLACKITYDSLWPDEMWLNQSLNLKSFSPDYSENESDDGYKKKRKKKRAKGSAAQQPQQQPQLECNEESEGEQLEADQQGDLVDYLPPLRALHCKIFLSEINRRLGAVMHQPGWELTHLNQMLHPLQCFSYYHNPYSVCFCVIFDEFYSPSKILWEMANIPSDRN